MATFRGGDDRRPRSGQGRGAVLVVLTAALMGGAACGDPSSPPAATTSAQGSADTSAIGDATPTAPAAPTTPSAPAPTGSTPGRAVEIPFVAGSSLSVVGVTHNDVLNVRRGPGTGFAVLTTLGPLAERLTTTGRGWSNGGPYWIEITTGTVTGWASARYLAGRDGTEDVTSTVISRLGRRPVAETMLELGRTVAGARASTDPPSSIVVSVAPTVADLGEVTYDVWGLGDDSVLAERLHVFGQPAGGGGFSLQSVEVTYFCARGAPSGGLCP